MKSYLTERELGAFIFSIYSKTANFKVWNQYLHTDNLCYGCERNEDTFEHLLVCSKFGEIRHNIYPSDIFSEYISKVMFTAQIALKRYKIRNQIKKQKMDNPC